MDDFDLELLWSKTSSWVSRPMVLLDRLLYMHGRGYGTLVTVRPKEKPCIGQ